MRVLYFGTYSTGEGYPRNTVLIEGLRRAGVEVVECHEEFWADAAAKIEGATAARPAVAFRYLRAWGRLVRRYFQQRHHDAVVVGYTGQVDVFLARLLNALRGRPVVLDAFLSLHDTLVADRGLVGRSHPLAAVLRWLDSWSCRLADLVLLDTRAHLRRFSRITGLPPDRFGRLFVGEDDREFPFAPPPPTEARLRVLWFGTYVPLQGVDVVLAAAERLVAEPVDFRMVGRGQQLEGLLPRAERLPNVTLVPHWMGTKDLVEEIQSADVCLGIFGTTGKALRVIPCKVYDALAVGRAVITSATPGSTELLTSGVDALLVPPGDPAALAAAIRRLARDEALRSRLAAQGHETFLARASPDALGREFADLLRRLLRRRPASRGPSSRW